MFRAGSAEILGEFKIKGESLVVELAQIDGGGEGVLPTLISLARRYAKKRGLKKVQWIVHALNCAEPNLKLRRVMERRGFQIVDIEGVGKKAYFQIHENRLRVVFSANENGSTSARTVSQSASANHLLVFASRR